MYFEIKNHQGFFYCPDCKYSFFFNQGDLKGTIRLTRSIKQGFPLLNFKPCPKCGFKGAAAVPMLPSHEMHIEDFEFMAKDRIDSIKYIFDRAEELGYGYREIDWMWHKLEGK